MTITATAGAALLLGIASALQTTQSAVDQTIGLGLAEQLMDELASLPYAEPGAGPYQVTLGPESGEATTSNRMMCDDLDDYNGLVDQPPKDRWGIPLGSDDGLGGQRATQFQSANGLLSGLRREVEIYYVSSSDLTARLPAGQTSAFRSVHVRVLVVSGGRTTPLVDLNRVFAYVPTP